MTDIFKRCSKLTPIVYNAKVINESRNPITWFRRSIWNDLFYISRFKKKKKKEEVCPKWYEVNTRWYTNILFKNHVTNSEDAFIYEKRYSIDKSFFSKVSSSSSLRSPIDRCFRKGILDLDWKAKLTTSKSTFIRSLCRMVVYKMLKSKVEIDLIFPRCM